MTTRTPPSTRTRFFTHASVLGFLAVFLWGCQNPAATDANKEAAQKPGQAQPSTEKKPEAPAAKGGRAAMMGMMGPTQVTVVKPTTRTEPITMTAAGTLSSPNAVTLTPQVSGTLKSVPVQSGQKVTQGTLLFTLDAEPFRTALKAAEAKLAGDRAQATYADQQVKQLTPLVQKEYVTRQSFDQAVATAMAAHALIAQDDAAIQTAKINLSYTEIRAPIAGRLGQISLQPGNLVVANSTALTTLVSTQELLVNFSLPQSVLNDLRREWPSLGQPVAAGQASPPAPRVEVLDEHASHVLADGHLSFIDNSISATTGTIRLQGLVKNPDDLLWPGQFVTARLTLGTIPNAQIIPAGAVQLGDQGSFVYVFKDNKAEIYPISPLRTQATEVALAAGSLPTDAEIIYPLPSRIAPGMAVTRESAHEKGAPGEHKPNQPGHDQKPEPSTGAAADKSP
jgi:multidrug efflux system membrane fusion protein